MKTPKHAAIYTRISSDPHDTKLGVARQHEDCEKLAAQKGWTIAETYTDNDVSAHNGKQRPEYRRLLRDIESGAVDGVVVYHLSRLHRRPVELESFILLADAKSIPLASVAGDVDLGTSQGRLVARLMGGVDAHESEVKGERIRRKHLELAQMGKVVGGGRRPLGYSKNRLRIVADEAGMIREAARRLLSGDTLFSIVSEWNRAKKKTPMGSPWRPQVLRKLLCSARVAGLREYEGQTFPAKWPAILPLAVWQRLRRLLCDPARRTSGGARRRYLLSGVLRCGLCGELLTARHRAEGGRKRIYVCAANPGRANCGKLSVLADKVEVLVSAMVWEALDGPKLVAAVRQQRRAEKADDNLLDLIRDDEAQMDELAAMWAAKRITSSEWTAAREPLEARLQNARARLGADRGVGVVSEFIGKRGALAKAWDALTMDRRRAIIASILEKVTIRPAARGANTFDTSRVDVRWRF